IGGLVKACNGLIVRFELGRFSALIEADVDRLPVWLEEDGRIVAIELVRGFLVGLALPALVVGYDAPNVTGSYRAGFSTLQHRLRLGGNPVPPPIAMTPVAPPQLRTDVRCLISGPVSHWRSTVIRAPLPPPAKITARGSSPPMPLRRRSRSFASR